MFAKIRIGGKITQFAEQAIPLADSVAAISVHKTEQAAMLERAIAVGETLAADPVSLSQFDEIVEQFIALSHKVDADLNASESLLRETMALTHSDKERMAFEHLLALLEKVAAEQANYTRRAEQTISSVYPSRVRVKLPAWAAA